MYQKSRDELRLTKTELTRLVIQGPTCSSSAAATADELVGTLKEGAAAGSWEARLAGHLRGQFQAWFADGQTFDVGTQRNLRAAMLMAIGELFDLAGRRLR